MWRPAGLARSGGLPPGWQQDVMDAREALQQHIVLVLQELPLAGLETAQRGQPAQMIETLRQRGLAGDIQRRQPQRCQLDPGVQRCGRR